MNTEAAGRWVRAREQTPVTRDYAYLNCGWSGPLSTPVVEAMRARLDRELAHGPTTRAVVSDRTDLGDRLREAAARLFGAEAEEIAITGNTTEGINIAVNGIGLAQGDGVVTTSVEHSGGIVPAYYARLRRGADVRIVPLAANDTHDDVITAFDRAIDERTRLVIVSEISYSTGQLLPLGEIARLAHARGATVVVDGAQTAGHLPLDVRATGVDAYAIPSHKWLCGPDGLGMLYVRRDRIAEIEPSKVGGRAAASFDFAGGFEPQRERVTKFEVSTVSGALIAGTLAAVERYLEMGPQAVWERVRDLNRYAEARFDRIAGVNVVSPRSEESRTGLFLFSLAGHDPARVSAFLQQEGRVVCRSVKQFDAVRLSLNVYNTEDEIERAAALVERALADGIPEEGVADVTRAEARAAEET